MTAVVAPATIVVDDDGLVLGLTVEDVRRYHGPHSPGGAAIGFKALERALPLLSPGAPADRRAITIRTAFGGPGARDAFEAVTRAVTGGRYTVDSALARPERGRALERFVFVVGLGDREVTLLLREGFVTDQFVDLAARDDRSDEEERRLTALKRDLADRVLACGAEAVFDVDAT
jgi:hypothetical protein